ncbi:MAG TPA: type II toxin-antitoxin system RelE/ParE family toxin [Verrucomicrobiae bacterium]|jgi:toxin ParE1/3/4
MKYTVRPQSWLDIEETMTYLRDHADDEAAARFWQRTQDTFAALAEQPALGRVRPDLRPPGLRSWRVDGFDNWLVFYIIKTEIEIVRVRHGMMDLPKIFEEL